MSKAEGGGHAELPSPTYVAPQSVTKFITVTSVTLFTPKVGAKH
jgi:hypothetical protein